MIKSNTAERVACVVFDFDGTLVLSNDIKRAAFEELADGEPERLALMRDILSKNYGSRFEIIAEFAQGSGHSDPEALIKAFSRNCLNRISTCPERPGAADLLSRLTEADLPIYLNSASPETELREIVAVRYYQTLFRGVLGSPSDKVLNLQRIAKFERCLPSQMIMIGDGIDDYNAAIHFGCLFVAVADGSFSAAYPDHQAVANLGEVKMPLGDPA